MTRTFDKFAYEIGEPSKSWRCYAVGISDAEDLDADLRGAIAELVEDIPPPFKVRIWGITEELADFRVSDVNDLVTKRATERF